MKTIDINPAKTTIVNISAESKIIIKIYEDTFVKFGIIFKYFILFIFTCTPFCLEAI